MHGKESHICRLKKALYGLKQALRAWYARIDSYLMRHGFTKRDVDLNLYFKVMKNTHVILFLHVDYLFLISVEPLII